MSEEGKKIVDYNEIFENLPGGIYWKDTKGVYQGCNQFVAKMAGFSSPNEILGKTDQIISWKQYGNLFIKYDKKVLAGETINTDEKLSLENGDSVIFNIVKSPRKDKNGLILGVLGTFIDITGRIRKEEKTELYLQNIISRLPGSVYWKDKNGIYLGCNQFVADMAGVSSVSEVVGKTDAELFSKNAIEWKKNDDEVLSTGLEHITEEPVIWPNGKQYTYLAIKAPLKNKNNEFIGIIGISLDISRRKETEKCLEEALSKLKLADKSKQILVEKIMAELRTPLHSISMAAQLLFKIDTDPTHQEYFLVIESASRTIEKILGQFLSYLTFDTPQRGPLIGQDVRVLLEDLVVKKHLQEATIKNTDIILHYDWDLPQGLGFYPEPVTEVLNLLLSNAIRFTSEGCIVLKVWLEFAENKKNHDYLWFSIIDTGTGISKIKQKDLFNFYEDRDGTTGSSGFSLSRAYRTIQQMQGILQVNSELSKGSCFSLKIPVSIPPLEYAIPKGKVDFSNYRFLVIDTIDMRGKTIVNMLHQDSTDYINSKNLEFSQENYQKYDFVIIDESISENLAKQLLHNLTGLPQAREISVYLLGKQDTLSSYPAFTHTKIPVYLIKKPILGTHFLRQLQPIASVLVIEDNIINLHMMKLLFQEFGVRVDFVSSLKEAKNKLTASIYHYYCVLSDIYLGDGSGIEIPRFIENLCKKLGIKRVRAIAITAHASQKEIDKYEQAGFAMVLIKPIQIADLRKILKRELPHELWRNPFPDEDED